jgi:fluoroacetyl-CoA thioesterase
MSRPPDGTYSEVSCTKEGQHISCLVAGVREMSFEAIKPGLSEQRDIVIEERHTVGHTKTPVLSTPQMISLMERVAMDLTQMRLPAGFTTVGYEVHVRHKAPVLLGSTVAVRARLQEVDGRKLLFEVQVTQGEKTIGEGSHRRTIIQIPE